jgi:6-phosphogluconate dehydrogenase
MGANLSRDALDKHHEVVGYDLHPDPALDNAGVSIADSLASLVAQLTTPRIVFLYVPHGEATESACEQLRPLLAPGDILVDGGNSHWTDSQRRHATFAAVGVRFLDLGTSGGVAGARSGACFMVGGDRESYMVIEPLLRDLAADPQATLFVGAPGTGHFSKLVHNAIEFGMVQAIGEGVELLQRSGFELDLVALLRNWNHGSVIRSWLIELMAGALETTPDFSSLSTYVEDTQEVKWVLAWALDQDIPTPVIGEAQAALMAYRDLNWPAAKAVALLRHAYGGHPVHLANESLLDRR